ncbi:taurine dioxygenase [Hypericibacter terrae]|uniref:Taurine dioxygenase n=1 Tax=Hypericibacter terrae TaxID=2602015 RepID=A0A5J6MHC1_9PROT|nr:taurine dioxygenase [Hypericibacter terrae]QEX16893.1 taurine dioxygenase [Hypericibacter terrae]
MNHILLARRLTVTPLSPAIGAVIDGVNLARPLDAQNQARIEQALLAHKVIFFEDQNLTPDQHRDFAARFGKLHIHPIYPTVEGTPEVLVLDTHEGNPPDNDTWHTDVTFIETPPLGAVLYAKQLPPLGGDTIWSNSIAAYETLSTSMRTLLDGLTATHDFEKSFPRSRYATTPDDEAKWLRTRATHRPVVHPVVRTHPQTGRKGLFVNEGFTTHINELTRGESESLLRYIFTHVARPEFTVRHRWKPNTVAMWDNRCTQHYALADYLPHRRVMHRATILGDRPR